MNEYALAAIAGIWLADGLSLLVAPRFVVERVRETLQGNPSLLIWQLVSVVAGIVLLVGTLEFRYQPLWTLTATSMMTKGLFLAWGSPAWRAIVIGWCLQREDVDYRFLGIGLCTLAVLLLHALGWLGHE
ncbi:hypothetical protein ACO9S2_09165 [Nitrospira sp. NS4]|uniref:hypothetical protein n=1 Tax=Nitrospira sp. NS4 TaxID=3414498 RepID=UPI003C2B397C